MQNTEDTSNKKVRPIFWVSILVFGLVLLFLFLMPGWPPPSKKDILIKTSLRNASIAQDYYYVDHKRYANSIEKLSKGNYGLSIFDGVTVKVIFANENIYKMEAFGTEGNKRYLIRGPAGKIEESSK